MDELILEFLLSEFLSEIPGDQLVCGKCGGKGPVDDWEFGKCQRCGDETAVVLLHDAGKYDDETND